MAIDYDELKLRVKVKIRADLGTPAVNDLHDDSIKTWANEYAPEIIQAIKNPLRLKLLFSINANLSGRAVVAPVVYFTIPANYEKPIATRVTGADVTNRDVEIVDYKKFSFMDSQNILTTPDEERNPVCMIADKVYYKPTTITSARLDYIKVHPEIEANGTKFDGFGDILLTKKLLKEYYYFIGQAELADKYDRDYINMLAIEEKRYL